MHNENNSLKAEYMKIVVDSGCDLLQDNHKKILNIESIPLSLMLENETYVDDEKLNLDGYMQTMEASKNSVKTAAPSPELFMNAYGGNESVFVVTLSSKLSASYTNAVLAKQMYLDEIGKKCIHVFDSLSASSGQTIIAMKINELIQKNLEESEIIAKVTKFIEDMKTYFILEKYDNAVKNGRMKPYVAIIASTLSICPICASVGGKMEVVEKARGAKRAMAKLIDMMVKEIEKEKIDFKNRVLAISHVKCLEKANAFKEAVLQKIPFKDVVILETTGLCSTYAERGGIVVAY